MDWIFSSASALIAAVSIAPGSLISSGEISSPPKRSRAQLVEESGLYEGLQKTLDPEKILAPGCRLVCRYAPTHFRRWPVPVGKHADGREPSRPVGRIAIYRKIAGDFAMGREIGGNDWRSDGQRFDHGQAEPFGKGRHQ